VEKLKSSRDSGYAAELVGVLAEPRTPLVRKAILGLLEEQGEKGGEEAAKDLVSKGEEKNVEVVSGAIRYLSAIGAQGLSPLLAPFVDAPEGAVSSAAIRALGRSGDPANAPLLIARLKSAEFSDARKADVILALGDLKDPTAVDVLIRVVANADEGTVRRMYAADSLGKIGDARALPALKALFGERDALLRAYAASALAPFSLDEIFPLLLQGLKDENWKVRLQCARSIGRALAPEQASAALPILSYKARFDPASQVRIEAIHALGEIGGEAALSFLIELYTKKEDPPATREAALAVLVARALPGSLDAIRSVVEDEWKAADRRTLEATARALSGAVGASLETLFLRLLESANPVIRVYAIRGIAGNTIVGCKARLRDLSEKDPSPAVRAEADRALAKL
jgi:HEAT repeat protein